MQQCLLLPSVNETFSSFVSELVNQHVEGKVKGRWILSNLVVCLQHHLSYTCKVRKHGTLLYRSNGDQTLQCGCKAKGQACGECTNTDMNTTANSTNSLEETSIEEIVEDSPPEDLDEVMEWVFGEQEAELEDSDPE